MASSIKRGDWVITTRDTAGSMEGMVKRVAADGSWADVDWGAWSKRMPTAHLRVVAILQRGDWTITDVTRANELRRVSAEPGQSGQSTRVVHCRKDAFDVYIGRQMPRYPELRATGWGNPYTARNLPPGCANAVEAYRMWIATQPRLLARLPELRGKTIGCWCAPAGGLPGDLNGRVCHGEVLASLADGATMDGAE